jgi:hypothetical protein
MWSLGYGPGDVQSIVEVRRPPLTMGILAARNFSVFFIFLAIFGL